jgi:hypothetical protein
MNFEPKTGRYYRPTTNPTLASIVAGRGCGGGRMPRTMRREGAGHLTCHRSRCARP